MPLKDLLNSEKLHKKEKQEDRDPEYLVNLRKLEIQRIIEATYDSDHKIKPELTPEEIQNNKQKEKKLLYLNIFYIILTIIFIIALILGAYFIGS
ncbi:hypothetical protein [Mycoplasmopsis sturni]|uniref:hypothetical protein n=1 Tax=Mycoplasmopsis sturni TaxID=39047 RepID=UPI000560429D|nr:hypothetical protein [Mycoplasmopsis sturni]